MRMIPTAVAVLALAATFVASAGAAPNDSPFPSPTVVDVFIAAQTVTTDGTMSNQFAPGSTVVFRAYATLPKSRDVLVAKDVRYFYVSIPNQPSVKLTYNPAARGASARMPWTGTWQVPATFTPGLVPFKVLVQTVKKLRGSFVQFPVSSAMLTIAATPQIVTGPASTGTVTPITAKQDLSLYADTVNGTRPSGAKPRPVGCTQSNVFKRGEQVVVRSWGVDLTAGSALLTNENVDKAEMTVPGLAAPIAMSWGPHGATNARVFFWTGVWNVAADFPLGDVTLRITYTTINGKTSTYEHPLTIIP